MVNRVIAAWLTSVVRSTATAWTDVSRCAEGTFVGYAPACSCGWRGAPQPATAAGRLWCTRLWRDDHPTRLDCCALIPGWSGRRELPA